MSTETLSVPQAEPSIAASLSQDKQRLFELERVIERTYKSFLECGRALLAIREERLYRFAGFDRFSDYVVQRWALSRSRADELCRATEVAQVLLASTGGAETQSPLPTTISEVTLRPLTKLSTELQRQVWPLICAVSPEREPTPHVVATVVRTVRNAIAKAYAGKNGANAQPVPKRETIFLNPVQRLAHISSFSAELAIIHVDDAKQAKGIIACCDEVISRCNQVKLQLHPKLLRQ